MDLKPLDRLPSSLVEKCRQFGVDLADHYRGGGSPNSRAVSTHGMQDNPDGLAASKMAECMFCLRFGVDPLALPWSLRADPGWDIVVFGQRVDVKSTWLHGKFLIWPMGKNHLFDAKQFDMLALVKLERDEKTKARATGAGVISGWIPKRDFRQRRMVAGNDHALDAGARYMPEDELLPIENGGVALARRAIAERKQFEFISGRWP